MSLHRAWPLSLLHGLARGQHPMGAPLLLEPGEGLKDHILVPKASGCAGPWREGAGLSLFVPLMFSSRWHTHDSGGHLSAIC